MTFDFDYRLAVLTHGNMETLNQTLDSFFAHVSPRPSEVFVYADGVSAADRRAWMESRDLDDRFHLRFGPDQQGFCVATGMLWRWVSEPPDPYVFWLEHDFEFLRDVDLRELAVVLDSDHRLAQMALVRGAANPKERDAGGLIESRPGEFDQMCGVYDGRFVHPTPPWLRHRAFFTTNPSLMRRRLMAERPWPMDGRGSCEGRYGIDLVAAGYEFGFWGAGEPWVEHIGVRNGFGY